MSWQARRVIATCHRMGIAPMNFSQHAQKETAAERERERSREEGGGRRKERKKEVAEGLVGARGRERERPAGGRDDDGATEREGRTECGARGAGGGGGRRARE